MRQVMAPLLLAFVVASGAKLVVKVAVNAERRRHYTAGDALCLMPYALCYSCGETETLYGR